MDDPVRIQIVLKFKSHDSQVKTYRKILLQMNAQNILFKLSLQFFTKLMFSVSIEITRYIRF